MSIFATIGPVQYDPRTRDFAGKNGKYNAVHWVDQFVVMNVTIERGAIKSAPNVGATYRQIKLLDERTIQADVEDRTRLALAPVLAPSAKIEILGVDVDIATRGQLKIAVTYRNLLTRRVQSITHATPFG